MGLSNYHKDCITIAIHLAYLKQNYERNAKIYSPNDKLLSQLLLKYPINTKLPIEERVVIITQAKTRMERFVNKYEPRIVYKSSLAWRPKKLLNQSNGELIKKALEWAAYHQSHLVMLSFTGEFREIIKSIVNNYARVLHGQTLLRFFPLTEAQLIQLASKSNQLRHIKDLLDVEKEVATRLNHNMFRVGASNYFSDIDMFRLHTLASQVPIARELCEIFDFEVDQITMCAHAQLLIHERLNQELDQAKKHE